MVLCFASMFDWTFERPLGSPADVKELEYIAALHQAGKDDDVDWSNPSISAEDVQTFLMSRHGIKVEKEEVLQQIFHGLAGGETDQDCIDLVEMVSMLIIPYLVKTVSDKHPHISKRYLFTNKRVAEYEQDQEELQQLAADKSSMISHVLNIILQHTTPTPYLNKEPPRLTKELLQSIFVAYGESDLAKDDNLLEEMILTATDGSPGGVLDVDTFVRGLISDIGLYDVNMENRVSTHFDDVFHAPGHDLTRAQNEESDFSSANFTITDEETNHVGNPKEVTRVFSFPQIDFLSSSFRSRHHYLLVWIALVMFVLTYTPDGYTYDIKVGRCKEDQELGCAILGRIISWLFTFALYTVIGTPFVMVLSLGNRTTTNMTSYFPFLARLIGKRTSTMISSSFPFLVGIVGSVMFVILPAYVRFNFGLFQHIAEDSLEDFAQKIRYSTMEVINTIIGCLLLLIHLVNIVGLCSEKVRIYSQGSSLRNESDVKRACRKKIHQLVKNAYDLHDETDYDASHQALLNYDKLELKKESTKFEGNDGLELVASSLWSEKLVRDEGIILPNKLYAGQIAQFLMLVVLYATSMNVAYQTSRNLLSLSETPFLKYFEGMFERDESCYAKFDVSSCIYPQDSDKYLGPAVCATKLPTCFDMKKLEAGFSRTIVCTLFKEFSGNYSNTGNNQCSDIRVPSTRTMLFANMTGSNETSFCRSPIAVCDISKSTDKHNEGICILGFSHLSFTSRSFAPSYEGELCNEVSEINEIIEDFNDDMMSQIQIPRRILSAALFIAPTIAFLVGLASAISFLPNITILILKFRSGVIETMRDKDMARFYRNSMHRTSSLFGCMFWGALFSFLSILFLVGLILVLFALITQRMFATLFGTLIAMIVASIIRITTMCVFSSHFYKGFYRGKQVALVNIVNLALECWDLGLTAGFVALRSFKIALTSLIFIGRFDIPLLSDEANKAACIYVDVHPLWLRLSLLASDAHRHPYIERLGLLYMMKLKHADAFGKRSGSTWRLLFVFALMPWLRKYRILKTVDHKRDSYNTETKHITEDQAAAVSVIHNDATTISALELPCEYFIDKKDKISTSVRANEVFEDEKDTGTKSKSAKSDGLAVSYESLVNENDKKNKSVRSNEMIQAHDDEISK